jgi:hypothetical protein
MTDHFSVIGFKASSAEDLSSMVSGLLEKGGEKKPVPHGYYHRWKSPAGSELWIHMQRAQDASEDAAADPFVPVGITPFFAGQGRAPIRVRAMRQRPSDNLFEGAFYVEIGPTIALIDVVDFASFIGRPTPFMAIAQIVAFPHELVVFENEAAFLAAQTGQDVKFTPRSFIASGLFVGGDSSGDIVFLDPESEDFRAPARAFLTGEVEKTERRLNPETGQNFTWALIITAGGTFDLVADDSVLSAPLAPGMIVQGEFWLCGRLVDPGLS